MKKFFSFVLIFGMLCTVGFSGVGCGKKEEVKKTEVKKDNTGEVKKEEVKKS